MTPIWHPQPQSNSKGYLAHEEYLLFLTLFLLFQPFILHAVFATSTRSDFHSPTKHFIGTAETTDGQFNNLTNQPNLKNIRNRLKGRPFAWYNPRSNPYRSASNPFADERKWRRRCRKRSLDNVGSF